MHVVVSGYYGFGNAGDEAVLDAIVSSLRRLDPSVGITVLSAQPQQTATRYRVGAVHRMRPLEVLRALRRADALISGGGSLLQDATGPRSIPYYTTLMALAEALRKPVFIYAQGVGPVSRRSFYPLIRHVFRRAAYISVRDEGSADLLARIGVPRQRVEVVADPVFALEPAPAAEVDAILARAGLAKPFVAVSVRPWGDGAFLRAIATSLDRLAAEGLSVGLLALHPPADAQACATVRQHMQRPDRAATVDGLVTARQWMGVVGRAALVISVRLHALIFAAAQHVPLAGIAYDPKITQFLARIGEEPVGSPADLAPGALTAAALDKLARADAERARLRKAVDPLRDLAMRPAEAVYGYLRRSPPPRR